jgi:hypothetical protein
MRLCPQRRCCSRPSSRQSPPRKKEGPLTWSGPVEIDLGRLADLVDLGPAVRARAHCCRLAVLHRDRHRVFHFDLSLVLQAVAFQLFTILSLICAGSDSAHSRGGSWPNSTPIQPEFKHGCPKRPKHRVSGGPSQTRNVARNATSNASHASSPNSTNRTSSGSHPLLSACIKQPAMTRAHSSIGNPAMPVPTAGMAIVRTACSRARRKTWFIEDRNDAAVVRPPSAMLAA